MAKRNELPALAASLLITLALLGGGAWWLSKKFFGPAGGGPNVTQPSVDAGEINVAKADGSSGRSILPGEVSGAKQKGLDALAAKDYTTAQTELTAALQAERNDPEGVIYLNNAEIGDRTAYSIAAAVPTSSQFIGPGLEIMRGVAQAQSEVNQAGGIDGTPLKVKLLNDQDDPTIAKQVATALVEDSSILGVVGHYSSDTTLAAAEVYEAGQLAAISPTSTAVSIANAGDYIFRTVPSDRLAAAALARYVLDNLRKTQAAVFYTGQSAYSQSVQSEFTTELLSNGGQVVADFDVDDAGFSAGRAVQTAKQAGAEVIMLALTEKTDAISLQVLSVNQRELPVVGGDSLYDFNILDVGREDSVGLTVAVPWHVLSHLQSPFVTGAQQLWGATVSWRTATAYDAVMTLVAAMKAGDATRQGTAKAMSAPSFSAPGSTAQVRFFPTGDRNQPSQLVTVVKKAGPGRSGTGYDYEPVR